MIDTSYIIPPVPRELIKSELKHKHFLRKTNAGNKEIYITTAHLSPNIMREIGRLRELSFVLEGGGTGKDCDIDEFDTMPEPYCFKQLFVWSLEDEEIVGGYRFIHGSNITTFKDGRYASPTSELFKYSDEFLSDYMPYTVELGRAFVQPAFQPSNNLRKGFYSLDNLWDGLGAIALEMPETKYFFGKVTFYSQMNSDVMDLLQFFLRKHFPDRDGLVQPFDPVKLSSDLNHLSAVFNGRNYKEDYQILQHKAREMGSVVPPMISAYMSLSPTMRTFGTAPNPEFGMTFETGIMVTIRDIAPEKWSRYAHSYDMSNKMLDRMGLFKINMKRLPWWKKSSEQENDELRGLKRLKQMYDKNR